ncbi:MAG: hypothetical protein ABJN14_15985 [Paracoccaceae bacterium]
MTFFNDTPHAGHNSVLSSVKDWFFALGQAMYESRGMQERLRQIDDLKAKSDEELKAMGLKREDIPTYVFRHLMHL